MKVVLFCGGLGTRLREYSETIPKPMVEIGRRPILWHLMRYYAHFGHTDFIVCLGHRGDYIRRHLLQPAPGAADGSAGDSSGWQVTFADTGLHSTIGERLLAVAPLLQGEDVFLANYSDGLSDLDLDAYLDHFYQRGAVASFLAVRPTQSFHHVCADGDGTVTRISPVSDGDFWINGGFFAFRREIFDHIGAGDELVEAPFSRLIARRQLAAYRNPGFWACMDTYKEQKQLDEMWARGQRPWAVWDRPALTYAGGGRAIQPRLEREYA